MRGMNDEVVEAIQLAALADDEEAKAASYTRDIGHGCAGQGAVVGI